MAPRTFVIAGAGIGGLTTALALAQRGLRVALFEQATRLEEVGAGIQLSPNAARILTSLGLAERLRADATAPQELIVRAARSGQVLAHARLGDAAESRYGAPYWTTHRADLQSALRAALAATPGVELHLGIKIEEFAIDKSGVTVIGSRSEQLIEGSALIGADGLWSTLRRRLGHRREPRFARHSAWRALMPAELVPSDVARPALNLWLGSGAHLVHYPVRSGRLINVVAIVRDDWRETGWSAPGSQRDLLDRFSADRWHTRARDLLRASERWQKWALYDCAPLPSWGQGPMTLLGDAAHPMLPYLAQGAAMAIEDAAVLADCLAQAPDDVTGALRRYEQKRRPRTTRAQRAARHNGMIYHLGSAEAVMRIVARVAMSDTRLLNRYDWLYGWKPD